MNDGMGVMICAEFINGKLASTTAELMGCGRRLADSLGVGLDVFLAGSGAKDCAEEAVVYGADRVFVVDNPRLKTYRPDLYLPILENLAKAVRPQIILLAHNSIGRDLGPKLAFRLETAVTTDCVKLAIEPGTKKLLQTKPVYGGNAMATFTSKFLPQIATVRPKTMTPAVPAELKKGEHIIVEAEIDPLTEKCKLLRKVTLKPEGISLEDADVVVAGGRGIGNAEGFREIYALAEILNGAVGASRPPCDNGWVPIEAQIGLTGKIIAPDLYFAIALSGASQHISGCSGSKFIVAINSDPDANIFREADLGVIDDWKQVLPHFRSKVKQMLAG